MNRKINKVSVIGSGIMGSRIACHFANIGVEVLLLDIANKDDSNDKNKIVNEYLKSTLKSKPAPIYLKNFHNRITTGNLEDDIKKIASSDWIIEVIIEDLEIKKLL